MIKRSASELLNIVQNSVADDEFGIAANELVQVIRKGASALLLQDALRSSKREEIERICFVLSEIGRAALPLLPDILVAMHRWSDYVRAHCIMAVWGCCGGRESEMDAVLDCVGYSGDRDESVRMAVLTILETITDSQIERIYELAMDRFELGYPIVRGIRLLKEMGSVTNLGIVEMVETESVEMRTFAIAVLMRRKSRVCLKRLSKYAGFDDSERSVIRRARRYLIRCARNDRDYRELLRRIPDGQ